ncbi:MAG: helix-turn-helix transcriptional regulator [Coriobacteriia bacterium]|nr:helix-turn-helix transcriptional regulator [Coriobacteriia bacterium]
MSSDTGLGDLLRRLRIERGEPLRVVAAAAGMDSTLLSRIERDERLPTSPQLLALAAHFGVPSEDLETLANASRMLRRHVSADAVIRAAEVIEARNVPREQWTLNRRDTHDDEDSWSAPPSRSRSAGGPLSAAMSFSMDAPAPAPAASGRSGRPRDARSERLADIEAAAADGGRAIETVQAATRDADSVIALRSLELLRQLRGSIEG